MSDPTRHLAMLQGAIDNFRAIDEHLSDVIPEGVDIPAGELVILDRAYIAVCDAVAEVDAEFWDVFEEEGLTPEAALLATAAFVGFQYVA
ncbi:hypothetical protein [Rhodococcus pyridinivorans]|uniref:hypothetical protein n=1 Tax=Rhodococcus pyridinivorans TaxID=103816 RepID=UPI003AAB06A2